MEEGRDRPSEGSAQARVSIEVAAMEEGRDRPSEGLAFYWAVDLGVNSTSTSGWFGGSSEVGLIRLSTCRIAEFTRLSSAPQDWWSHLTSRIR